jgi:hypothetical protein
VRAAVAIAVVLLAAAPSHADEPRFDAGVAFGWAFPAGNAEEGTRLSDSLLGAVPLTFDLDGRVAPGLGIGVVGRYGIVIPSLCGGSAGDCIASVGSDFLLAARARFYLPDLGPILPRVGVGLGWEWLATRFADEAAHASRFQHGPVPLLADVELAVAPSECWTLGLVGGLGVGTFVARELGTTAGRADAPEPDRAPHAWLDLGIRFGIER